MKKDDIPEELRSLRLYQKLWAVDSILWLIITPLLYFNVGSSAALVSLVTAAACWLFIGFLEVRKAVHKHFNYGEKGINFLSALPILTTGLCSAPFLWLL